MICPVSWLTRRRWTTNRTGVAEDLESKISKSLFGMNSMQASVLFTRAVLHSMNLQAIAIQQGNDGALVAQLDGRARECHRRHRAGIEGDAAWSCRPGPSNRD